MKDCVLRGTGTLDYEELEEKIALRIASCEHTRPWIVFASERR